MTPVEFIEQEEGRDGIQPDGTYAAVWDKLGLCWTIGCGLTQGITKTTTMSQAEVDAALQTELAAFEKAVDSLVKVQLTHNQRTALISFAYNCGVGALESSTLLKVLNEGHYDEVPAQLTRWVHAAGASGPVKGLVNRRNAEIALWRTPDDQPHPTASNTSNAPVPKASTPPIEKANIPMATSTTPAVNSDAFQALLAAAMADISAIKQKITGMFAGLASGGASIALAAMLPDKTMALIIGAVGGLAGFLTIIIHLYTLFTGLSANNSSTVLLFENGVNTAQRLVGLTPTVWDNGPAAPTATA